MQIINAFFTIFKYKICDVKLSRFMVGALNIYSGRPEYLHSSTLSDCKLAANAQIQHDHSFVSISRIL